MKNTYDGETTVGGFFMKKISFKVRSGENINKKRLVTAMVFFAVLLTGLLCRLFYIQIMCHDDLAEAAVSQ